MADGIDTLFWSNTVAKGAVSPEVFSHGFDTPFVCDVRPLSFVS